MMKILTEKKGCPSFHGYYTLAEAKDIAKKRGKRLPTPSSFEDLNRIMNLAATVYNKAGFNIHHYGFVGC